MRLVIYDATRKPSLLDESWGAGAFSMWFRERTEGMLGALSWEEVFTWLDIRVLKHGLIKEVQFWGHGTPGEAYINGEKITEAIKKALWVKRFTDDGLWWFRTCSTFNGEKGKSFAKDFSSWISCKIAGHTHKIGFPTHSGLHSILPNEEPNWLDNEGLNKNGNLKRSYFWRPNTIPFWKNTIPKEW